MTRTIQPVPATSVNYDCRVVREVSPNGADGMDTNAKDTNLLVPAEKHTTVDIGEPLALHALVYVLHQRILLLRVY